MTQPVSSDDLCGDVVGDESKDIEAGLDALPQNARRGLTEAEAVILRLHAKLGAKEALWEHLDPMATQPLVSAQARLEACEDREALLELWEEQDNARRRVLSMSGQAKAARRTHHLQGLDARWQRAASSMHAHPEAWTRSASQRMMVHLALHKLAYGPHQLDSTLIGDDGLFDLGFLCTIHHQARDQIIQRIGVYQLAQVLRALDRRRIARILREMPRDLQEWMREDFARERATHELELARIQEVFVGLQKRYNDWNMLAQHMGLFFVATSAGSRFVTRTERLGQLLPRAQSEAFTQYVESARWSSRRGLDDVVRTSLGALWPEIASIYNVHLGATQ